MIKNRSFKRRFTIAEGAVIALLAVVFVYLFLQKNALVLLPTALLVIVIERVVHGEYVFDDADKLSTYNGRFARTECIDLATVVRVECKRQLFGWIHYVEIEYGAGKIMSVVPQEEEEFVKYINQRLDETEE